MSFICRIFFLCYALLWAFALPFLRRKVRLRDAWDMRLIPHDWFEDREKCYGTSSYFSCGTTDWSGVSDKVDGVDIWLQAASGGEAYLAIEFLRELPKECRQLSILISSWTQQGIDVLEDECTKLVKEWHAADGAEYVPYIRIRFAPLDTEKAVKRAFDIAKPSLCIMLETELWPCFMRTCKERDIPFYVINGRITKSAYELYTIIKSVFSTIAPQLILATSDADAERFAKIFPASEISVMSNMKFDRAIKQLQMCLQGDCNADFEDKKQLKPLFEGASSVYLFASVREKEENLLGPVIWKLFLQKKNSLIIIAPRHMHRAKAWFNRLRDLGMYPVFASELFASGNSARTLLRGEHIIWDIFGDLNTLYQYVDVAFVGGSFKKLGGQNFLEANAFGLIPHVGPDLDNFFWALGEDLPPSLVEAGLMHIHKSKHILFKALAAIPEERLKNEERVACQEHFLEWVESRCGGAATTMKRVLDGTWNLRVLQGKKICDNRIHSTEKY